MRLNRPPQVPHPPVFDVWRETFISFAQSHDTPSSPPPHLPLLGGGGCGDVEGCGARMWWSNINFEQL